jgi:hypothetical protein
MDTRKTFFIREETKKNYQLNDKNIVCYNNIFEVILDRDSHCSDAQYSLRALSKVRGVFANRGTR